MYVFIKNQGAYQATTGRTPPWMPPRFIISAAFSGVVPVALMTLDSISKRSSSVIGSFGLDQPSEYGKRSFSVKGRYD